MKPDYALENGRADKLCAIGKRPWRRAAELKRRAPQAALPCRIHITAAEMRHFVLEDADRIRALNGEPTTRQWLPSHVYETRAEAVEAMNCRESVASQQHDTGALL